MKLSIIMVSLITTEFRLKLAERAIKHLREYSNDFEFIYVDNASPFRLKNEKDIDIYIRNIENVGITKAFNQAFKLSSGDIILFVDNDVDVRPDWQEKALTILENGYDALSIEECHDYINFEKDIFVKKSIRSPLYRDCFWLIKREVFEKIGLLDEGIFCYNEGLDFFIRMGKAGLLSAVTSDVQHWHLHGEMPYIGNDLKDKDMQYLKEKWKIKTNTDGINLAIQLFKKNKI